LPDFDTDDLELAVILLNTILEYEDVSDRLVEISYPFEYCLVFGDEKALLALAKKYDYTDYREQ